MYKFLLVAGMAFAMTSLQAQTSTATSNTQPSNTQTTTSQIGNRQATNGQSTNSQATNNPATSSQATNAQASNVANNSQPNQNQNRNPETSNNNAQNSTQAMNENGMQNQNMANSKEQCSNDVAQVLQDTHRARWAVSHQNKQQALTDVDNALQAAKQLSQASNNERFVPLYTELGEYSALGPFNASTNNAMNHSTAMSHNGNSQNWNNNKAENNNSANSTKNQTEVSDLAARRVVGQYTSVSLDTRAAESNLKAAKKALENGNLSEAKTDLAAVQNSVMTETVESDMPLLRARENLIIARMAARQGNFQQVHTSLEAASRALNAYEQEGGQYATQAQQLQSKINNYDQTVAQNHSNASARIQAFWNKTTDWVSPAQQAQTQSASNHANPMPNRQSSSNNTSSASSNNQ